jgi:hypothetical protein
MAFRGETFNWIPSINPKGEIHLPHMRKFKKPDENILAVVVTFNALNHDG